MSLSKKEFLEMLEKIKNTDLSCPKLQLSRNESRLKRATEDLERIKNRRANRLAQYAKLPSWDVPMDAGSYMDEVSPLISRIDYYKKEIKRLKKEVKNLK